MERYVLKFNEIDKNSLPYVGGKGANLGEMTKADFPVPQGFCVTTWAYKNFIKNSIEMEDLFDKLDKVNGDDLEQIAVLGQIIRTHLGSMNMPDDVKAAIIYAWRETGEDKAYAVRSSATAEDLPTASFAGQQDTYLNICGQNQLLSAVQKCWASLFTDRAIIYRAKNKFDHRTVFLSVVVQQMVFPEVSGIMFTADPITGRRNTVSIDASFGLGEALVSGLVTADLYQIRQSKIIKKQISKKKKAIYALEKGGTITKDIPLQKQEVQALADEKIIELAELGRKIEAHYGKEQDIEWGFKEGRFFILQSRPITSLYPLPSVKDEKFHVYFSFGHIQMMTDPMKPLAISLMSNITHLFSEKKDSEEKNFILNSGGRIFADITGLLLFKPSRKVLIKVFGSMDEMIGAAIAEVIKRDEFLKLPLNKKSTVKTIRKLSSIVIPVFIKVIGNLCFNDPTKAQQNAAGLFERITDECSKRINETSGADKILAIQKDMREMLPQVLAKVVPYFIAGVLASGKLKKKLENQVGEKECAYLMSQLNKSVPGNVTTELGLELGDLADMARNYPEVIEYLEKAEDDNFYEELKKVSGGKEFEREFHNFLKKYGMRCSGEIDITRPRWYEQPTQVVTPILSNIRATKPGEHREKFRQGVIEAEQAEKYILSKFSFMSRIKISRLLKLYRNLVGMREHHKFIVIMLLDIYKRAILEEAQILTNKEILRKKQDVYYLSLEELADLIENHFSGNVEEIIGERKKQYELNFNMTVPRVMTSEGEIITGKQRDVKAPEGALVGTPVSAGIVEGVARVIVNLDDAKLNKGEILVAPYTDPGWTPLFTSVVGLITEVGGMMTHGSVIAREYGIPAVVGIEKATEIIKDGDQIRINGTEGYVEILSKKV